MCGRFSQIRQPDPASHSVHVTPAGLLSSRTSSRVQHSVQLLQDLGMCLAWPIFHAPRPNEIATNHFARKRTGKSNADVISLAIHYLGNRQSIGAHKLGSVHKARPKALRRWQGRLEAIMVDCQGSD
jgi:hypothetical protein